MARRYEDLMREAMVPVNQMPGEQLLTPLTFSDINSPPTGLEDLLAEGKSQAAAKVAQCLQSAATGPKRGSGKCALITAPNQLAARRAKRRLTRRRANHRRS